MGDALSVAETLAKPAAEKLAKPPAFVIKEELERGQTFYKLLVENPVLGLTMDAVPNGELGMRRDPDELLVIFEKKDGSYLTGAYGAGRAELIDQNDIPGIDTTDRAFFEEFADRYGTKFREIKGYKDADDLMRQVFPDIMEARERRTQGVIDILLEGQADANKG